MARPLRIDVEGGIYHVVTRGIDRNPIFRLDGDREHFLDLMAAMYQRFRISFLAYVLMDNHVHFIVQTPDANLSRAMQWLKVSYSMWFNKKHQRVGPLFQGRFRSVLVEQADTWLLELSLYIHLNPVRLKALGLDKNQKKVEAKGLLRPSSSQILERMKILRAYHWSSFGFYTGQEPVIPIWLDRTEIMMSLPSQRPLMHYRELAVQRVSNEFDSDVLEKLIGRLALGSEGFIKQTRKLVGEIDRNIDCRKELKKRVSWEHLIQLAEAIRKESWDIIRTRHGDVGRAVVFRLARQYCGMTLKEIGNQAGKLDYAAVSDLIRRYEKCGKPDLMEGEMVKILNLET